MAHVKIDITSVNSKWQRSDNATIWIDKKTGMVNLKTPYDPEYIDKFRELVPQPDRRWDKDNKIWKFNSKYIDDVVSLTEKYFNLEMLPEISVSDASNADKLLRHLSLEGLAKVWRIVASELHPDKGGSAEAFVEAKSAYDNLTKGGK